MRHICHLISLRYVCKDLFVERERFSMRCLSTCVKIVIQVYKPLWDVDIFKESTGLIRYWQAAISGRSLKTDICSLLPSWRRRNKPLRHSNASADQFWPNYWFKTVKHKVGVNHLLYENRPKIRIILSPGIIKSLRRDILKFCFTGLTDRKWSVCSLEWARCCQHESYHFCCHHNAIKFEFQWTTSVLYRVALI